MAEKDIDVTVRLRDQLSRPAEAVEDAIEDVGDAASTASVQVGRMESSLDDLGGTARGTQRGVDEVSDKLAALSRAAGTGAATTKQQDRALGALTRAAAAAQGSLASLNREVRQNIRLNVIAAMVQRKYARVIATTGEGVVQFYKTLTGVGTPSIIAGLSLIVSLIGALALGAYAAAAQLGPMVGLLGAIPALAFAAGTGMAAYKLGMSGIGDAVAVLGDANATVEQINEALAGLGPEARTFAMALADAKKEASVLRDIAQRQMLPGFTDALADVMTLLPVVEVGISRMATVLGGLARGAGREAATWGDDLTIIFERSARIVQDLGRAFGWTFVALKNMAIVGGPMAERFSQMLERIGTRWAEMSESGRESGAMLRFFDHAEETARGFFATLRDIGAIMYNLGVGSEDLGNMIRDGLGGAISTFREFTDSAEGKQAVADYFRAAMPQVEAFGKLILDVIKGFGTMANDPNVGPIIDQIRTELLPAFLEISQAVTGTFGPALVDLGVAWLDFMKVVTLEPVADLMIFFGDLAKFGTELLQNNPGLAKMLATIIALSLGFRVFVGLLRVTGLAAFIGKLGTMARVANGLRLGLLGVAAAQTASNVAMQRGAAVGRILRAVMATLLGPVGLVILAIGAIIGVLVYLYKTNDEFKAFVDKAWAAIKDAVVGAWQNHIWPALKAFGAYLRDVVWPLIQALWRDHIQPVFAAIGQFIATTWTQTIWPALQAMAGWIMGTLVPTIQRLWTEYVQPVFAAIGAAAVWLWHNVIAPAFRLWWGYVTNVLMPVLSALWTNIVKPIFQLIGAWIGFVWGTLIWPILKLWWGYITNVLVPVLKFLWENVVKPVFKALGEFIKWNWDNVIKPALTALWTFLRDTLFPILKRLWEEIIKPTFESIGAKIKDTWENIIKPALETFKTNIDNLRGTFDTAKEKVQDFVDKLQDITIPSWVGDLADTMERVKDAMGGAAGNVREFFGGVGDAPAGFRGTRIGGQSGGMSLGGGRSPQGYSGTALRRVQQMLPGGLSVTSTYRSPARNRAVGGSPTSLHMDANNPAVDIGGPTALLDRFASQLRAVGGWRQLLWRVAGHYDHIHVAHSGGLVEPSWGNMPGLKVDERPAILQTGERVLSRAQNAVYEKQYIAPAPAALPTRAPALVGGPSRDAEEAPADGWPAIQLHFHGQTEPNDVEAAVARTVRRLEQERKERR